MAGDAPKSAASASEKGLLSPATAGAVSGMFAQLAAFGREQRRLTEFPMGAQLSMEDVVRELLHPMMRDWLDMKLISCNASSPPLSYSSLNR